MLRIPWAALAATALLLTGCLHGGAPARLSTSAGPWQPTPESRPWVTMSWGCGFCSGSRDHPEFTLLGVDRDGRVFQAEYSLGHGTQPLELADADLEPWRPRLVAAFQDGDPYAATGYNGTRESLRVHSVAAKMVTAEDWPGIRAAIEHGLARGGASHGQVNVTDCGSDILEGPADPPRAEAGCGIEPGAGWAEVQRQLQALADWMGPAAD